MDTTRPTGHPAQPDEPATMRAALDFLGIHLQGGGGGTTFLVLPHGDTETVITAADGGGAPDSLTEPVDVGLYNRETWTCEAQPRRFSSLAIALLELYGGTAGEALPEALRPLLDIPTRCAACGEPAEWRDTAGRCRECSDVPLLDRLRHHVTGAVERGEAEAIEAHDVPGLTERLARKFPRRDWAGDTWQYSPGRVLTFNGYPVATVHREGNGRDGWPLTPHEADLLAKLIPHALNAYLRGER